jgi:hypothetical protein
MKIKLHRPCFSLLICVLVLGCASGNAEKEKDYVSSSDKKVKYLLKKVLDINNNSPSSFSAKFVIEGRMSNNKSFKSLGDAVFSKKPLKMKVTFYDFVFKSPLTVMLQDEKILKFYFPVDKKLLLDNEDSIIMKNYTNIELDFKFLNRLTMGLIPLIDNYRIKQSLVHKSEKTGNEDEMYIILENDRLYQTISFRNDIPDKILLVNKLSKDKVEFYLESPQIRGNVLYFKTIRFISQQSGDKINIQFNSIRFNQPVNIKDISHIKMARDVKVVKIN